MGWVSGIVVYVMIWWVLIFMILPWRVRPETHPVSGCVAEAPARPYLGIKFALTTVLAALIWVGVHNWILQ